MWERRWEPTRMLCPDGGRWIVEGKLETGKSRRWWWWSVKTGRLGRRCRCRWCGCTTWWPVALCHRDLVPCPQTGPVLRFGGGILPLGSQIGKRTAWAPMLKYKTLEWQEVLRWKDAVVTDDKEPGRWSGGDGPLQAGMEFDSGHWTLKWTGLQQLRPASLVANRCDWPPLPAWQPPVHALTVGLTQRGTLALNALARACLRCPSAPRYGRYSVRCHQSLSPPWSTSSWADRLFFMV